MNRKGFTLVELSMVLLVLGIAAAAVALRVQRPLMAANLSDITGSLVDFDRTTRAASRSQDRPLRMVMNLSHGTVTRADAAGKPIDGSAVSLPQGYRLARLLVHDKDFREGETTIACSRAGCSPTYAILVQTPANTQQWLVFAGLTGQTIQVANDDEAKQILAATLGGNHAH